MTTSPDGAVLSSTAKGLAMPGVLVLVLHGGNADSFAPTRAFDPAVIRLWPIARVIARRNRTAAVYRLRFAIRGWNVAGEDAVRDARWAIAQLRARHPDVPVVLVGHSMGARVAVHTGGDPGVAGIVLLAQWTPDGDPVAGLAGKPVITVQGGRDRVIPPKTTLPWMSAAERAGALLQKTLLPWGGHTMVRRFWVWHRLAAQAIAAVLTLNDQAALPPQPLSP